MSSTVQNARRILVRSGKSPFDVVPTEESLQKDLIATNSGNLIFSDATHKILQTPGTEVVSNGIRTIVSEAARINEEFDVFVVPLANAFRPSFEAQLKRLTKLIRRLRIPVVVVGVGAQTGLNYDPARLKPIEPAVRDFVSAVLDRSATIGVRGEFTEQYLKDMGFRDVEVIGCPSMFMYGKELHVAKRAPELTPESRVAVNGSHSAVQKQGLGRLITSVHARYPHLRFIGQNLSDARQLHWRDLSDPNAKVTAIPTHPDHPMYREDKVRVYLDPVVWIDELRSFDFSFGSRIHGNIAALLAGTPATVLVGDSRTLELCRYFEIPHRRIDKVPPDLDPAELYAEADFGPLLGGHAERFERFTSFLERNGLRNTFTHGDGGAAFEQRLRKLRFPGPVRPWLGADLGQLADRMAYMQRQLAELSTENDRLRREVTRLKESSRKPGGLPAPSVYRRARRVVGPLRRALGTGRR